MTDSSARLFPLQSTLPTRAIGTPKVDNGGAAGAVSGSADTSTLSTLPPVPSVSAREARALPDATGLGTGATVSRQGRIVAGRAGAADLERLLESRVPLRPAAQIEAALSAATEIEYFHEKLNQRLILPAVGKAQAAHPLPTVRDVLRTLLDANAPADAPLVSVGSCAFLARITGDVGLALRVFRSWAATVEKPSAAEIVAALPQVGKRDRGALAFVARALADDLTHLPLVLAALDEGRINELHVRPLLAAVGPKAMDLARAWIRGADETACLRGLVLARHLGPLAAPMVPAIFDALEGAQRISGRGPDASVGARLELVALGALASIGGDAVARDPRCMHLLQRASHGSSEQAYAVLKVGLGLGSHAKHLIADLSPSFRSALAGAAGPAAWPVVARLLGADWQLDGGAVLKMGPPPARIAEALCVRIEQGDGGEAVAAALRFAGAPQRARAVRAIVRRVERGEQALLPAEAQLLGTVLQGGGDVAAAARRVLTGALQAGTGSWAFAPLFQSGDHAARVALVKVGLATTSLEGTAKHHLLSLPDLAGDFAPELRAIRQDVSVGLRDRERASALLGEEPATFRAEILAELMTVERASVDVKDFLSSDTSSATALLLAKDHQVRKSALAMLFVGADSNPAAAEALAGVMVRTARDPELRADFIALDWDYRYLDLLPPEAGAPDIKL